MQSIAKNLRLIYEIEKIPGNMNLFKVNNRNTRKMFEICSKLTMKTPR